MFWYGLSTLISLQWSILSILNLRTSSGGEHTWSDLLIITILITQFVGVVKGYMHVSLYPENWYMSGNLCLSSLGNLGIYREIKPYFVYGLWNLLKGYRSIHMHIYKVTTIYPDSENIWHPWYWKPTKCEFSHIRHQILQWSFHKSSCLLYTGTFPNNRICAFVLDVAMGSSHNIQMKVWRAWWSKPREGPHLRYPIKWMPLK